MKYILRLGNFLTHVNQLFSADTTYNVFYSSFPQKYENNTLKSKKTLAELQTSSVCIALVVKSAKQQEKYKIHLSFIVLGIYSFDLSLVPPFLTSIPPLPPLHEALDLVPIN
jgi:hypothetical protein